jgi:hypothetical protein
MEINMPNEETFTSDARLFAAIRENFPHVYVRFVRDWDEYQLTTVTKYFRPDYDAESACGIPKPYCKEEQPEVREGVFETARQMQTYGEAK